MRNTKFSILAGLLACALLTAPAAQADLGFNVQMSTAALVGHGAGPFSLDFQFTDGDGAANNTVTLTNFAFAGGSATGSPLTLLGGTSGSLTGGVTLPGSSFLAEFEQGFTPGSLLSFDVQMTTNFAGGTPDSFTLAILDNTASELPTRSPSDVFLRIDVTGASPTIQTFASDPRQAPAGGGTALSIPAPTILIPEPGTAALVVSGLLPVLGIVGRRLRA